MISEAPPEGWREEIVEARTDRDTYFREDEQSPLRADSRSSFAGLDYWGPDPGLRFVGPVHRWDAPYRFEVITTAGDRRPCERYGWVTFRYGGTRHNLQVYRLLDSRPSTPLAELFVPFLDRTSGGASYPAGRYIPLSRDPDGRFVLDFNRAHNPHCAYGSPERFACPVTPAENRLSVAIEAGERGWTGEDASGAS